MEAEAREEAREEMVEELEEEEEGKMRGEVVSSGSSPWRDRRALRIKEARWERERERCRGSMVVEEGESGDGSAAEGRERRIDS